MSSTVFLFAISIFFFLLFLWAFRNLPSEGWQIMATVPYRKQIDGSWRGINLTYYGFFNAGACVIACAILIILMSSIDTPLIGTLSVTGVLLLLCFPAAKLIARLVEKKSSTFTVGGASFVGFLLMPWLIQLFNQICGPVLGVRVPVVQMLAAAAISYAFGEAFGRLACISFGCCYGKALDTTPSRVQKFFRRSHFVFKGETKKVAYEAALSGRPLVPIQAVTAILSVAAGLAGTLFFLRANWMIAAVIPIGTTQIWRVVSEIFRADYRGGGAFSAYQIMALLVSIYSVAVLSILTPIATAFPDVSSGLRSIARPEVLLLLEGVWLAVFIFMGRSSVTGASISFHVVRDRV